MLALVHLTIGIAAIMVVTVAALQDVRERLIGNRLVVQLLGAGILHQVMLADGFTDWLTIAGSALALAAIVFAIGFVTWRLGGLGGGDVKLLVAACFFVGSEGALVLFAGVALAGGALALAYLVMPRFLPIPTAPSAPAAALGSKDHSPTLPYGVAIAAGFACAVVPSLPILIG